MKTLLACLLVLSICQCSPGQESSVLTSAIDDISFEFERIRERCCAIIEVEDAEISATGPLLSKTQSIYASNAEKQCLRHEVCFMGDELNAWSESGWLWNRRLLVKENELLGANPCISWAKSTPRPPNPVPLFDPLVLTCASKGAYLVGEVNDHFLTVRLYKGEVMDVRELDAQTQILFTLNPSKRILCRLTISNKLRLPIKYELIENKARDGKWKLGKRLMVTETKWKMIKDLNVPVEVQMRDFSQDGEEHESTFKMEWLFDFNEEQLFSEKEFAGSEYRTLRDLASRVSKK